MYSDCLSHFGIVIIMDQIVKYVVLKFLKTLIFVSGLNLSVIITFCNCLP